MAKKKTNKPKQASGGARLKAAGKRAVLLGLWPADHDLLRAAAEKDGRPLTQFLLFHSKEAAKRILEKSGN